MVRPSDEFGNNLCGKISVKELTPKPNKRMKINVPNIMKAVSKSAPLYSH